MSREKDACKWVLSQVAEVVNEMYEKYRRGKGLREEKDTEEQLNILVDKKYISRTYISNLKEIVECYEKDKVTIYNAKLLEYKVRVLAQIESIPY